MSRIIYDNQTISSELDIIDIEFSDNYRIDMIIRDYDDFQEKVHKRQNEFNQDELCIGVNVSETTPIKIFKNTKFYLNSELSQKEFFQLATKKNLKVAINVSLRKVYEINNPHIEIKVNKINILSHTNKFIMNYTYEVVNNKRIKNDSIVNNIKNILQ
jgi:hypothetical protein